MSAYQIISSNFPWCAENDNNSLTGRLHEDAVWDYDKYWQLELALYQICNQDISSEMRWRIFRIFSIVMMKFCAHFDKNDGFKIKNISREELYNFRERVQLVFEGVFQGKMPESNAFDITNPLMDIGVKNQVNVKSIINPQVPK